MQKVITLTLIALNLASCAINPQTTTIDPMGAKTTKSYSSPMCKHEIKHNTRDPLEILLSEDPWGLYEDKVVIPYLPTPKSKELPTFKIVCI